MEKETMEARGFRASATEADFVLQWGNRKRLRCIKIRDDGISGGATAADGRRRTTSRINRCVIRNEERDPPPPPLVARPPNLVQKRSESAGSDCRNSPSPEKEDLRSYTLRGALMAAGFEETGVGGGVVAEERGADAAGATPTTMTTVAAGMVVHLPRFFVSLSNKEKEEDFMAMKGCKLPQRPKKRSKLLQKCLLLVSPGAWLSDLSQERYEVREKRSSRRKKRGLKAMSMDSESE